MCFIGYVLKSATEGREQQSSPLQLAKAGREVQSAISAGIQSSALQSFLGICYDAGRGGAF